MEHFLLFKRLVSLALMPPVGFYLAALVLWLYFALMGRLRSGARSRRAVWRQALPPLLLCLGLLSSTGLVSGQLARWAESDAGTPMTGLQAKALAGAADGPRAIVVLAGGLVYDEREPYGPLSLSWRSAQRLSHAADLSRVSGLPLLLSGGRPEGFAKSEAEVMDEVLRRDFRLSAGWLEKDSHDTRDNATMSASILLPSGTRRIILVTQAIHMARARRAFEQSGFTVDAAPAGFLAGVGAPGRWRALPTPDGALRTWYASHELLGLAWYRVAGLFGQ